MCSFLIGGKRGQEVPIRAPAIAVRYHSAGRHSPLACPEEATADEGSLGSSSSCIALPPRLTWRPSTSYAHGEARENAHGEAARENDPRRSSADAIESQ